MTMTISEALDRLYDLSQASYGVGKITLGNELGRIADVIRSRLEVSDEMASKSWDAFQNSRWAVGGTELDGMKAALVAALGE